MYTYVESYRYTCVFVYEIIKITRRSKRDIAYKICPYKHGVVLGEIANSTFFIALEGRRRSGGVGDIGADF